MTQNESWWNYYRFHDFCLPSSRFAHEFFFIMFFSLSRHLVAICFAPSSSIQCSIKWSYRSKWQSNRYRNESSIDFLEWRNSISAWAQIASAFIDNSVITTSPLDERWNCRLFVSKKTYLLSLLFGMKIEWKEENEGATLYFFFLFYHLRTQNLIFNERTFACLGTHFSARSKNDGLVRYTRRHTTLLRLNFRAQVVDRNRVWWSLKNRLHILKNIYVLARVCADERVGILQLFLLSKNEVDFCRRNNIH